ncbi:MAG: ribonuclease P protein component [Firmicutes bacterium HGW-Firmicutes-12]|jgi:ribonuclease P protein component|nr:MAG: ribonuclease P protein component [Firmicutes bacterium HGW-Firmicutes-12]
MLKRRFRLKNKHEFKKTYQNGKTVANSYLVLYLIENKEIDDSKVAFAVGKRIGKAVVRNKIKRILREVYRKNMQAVKKNHYLIFIARAKIKGISYVNIEKSMLALLNKTGLISRK